MVYLSAYTSKNHQLHFGKPSQPQTDSSMEMLLDLSTMGSLGLDTALASPWIKTEPMLMGIDSAVFGGSAADADGTHCAWVGG